MEHASTLSAQNAEFSALNLLLYIVTTEFSSNP